jgi:hypothetical protein
VGTLSPIQSREHELLWIILRLDVAASTNDVDDDRKHGELSIRIDESRDKSYLEVHRALERNSAESSYLARHLSVFDDQQLVTRLPGTIVQGASAYAELDGERRDNILYWFGPPK